MCRTLAIAVFVFVFCLSAACRRTTPPAVSSPSEPFEKSAASPAELYDEYWKAGSKAHAAGNLDSAIEHFTAAIEANPSEFEAYLTRGVIHQELGDWDAALADYEKAREINPDDFASWNNIAMLLAACPDEELRSGAKAVEYAQKACQLSDWKHPAALNTLAIAYAELGDWQAATDICDEQLGKVDDGPIAEEFRVLRELFKQEKPYRLSPVEAE